MAFLGKAGNILRQISQKHINQEIVASKPSIFQMIRCLSSLKISVGGLSYSTDDRPQYGAGVYGGGGGGYGVSRSLIRRSYCSSMLPSPTRPLTPSVSFRLGECIILHFPKVTFIQHYFLPRQKQNRGAKSPPQGRRKGSELATLERWRLLTEGLEGLRKHDGLAKFQRTQHLDGKRDVDRSKRSGWIGWKKKSGYYDPSRAKEESLLRVVMNAFTNDPKYKGVVNHFRRKKSDGPTHRTTRIPFVVRSCITTYLLNTKNKIHFGLASDPMGADAQEGLDKRRRIRSRILSTRNVNPTYGTQGSGGFGDDDASADRRG